MIFESLWHAIQELGFAAIVTLALTASNVRITAEPIYGASQRRLPYSLLMTPRPADYGLHPPAIVAKRTPRLFAIGKLGVLGMTAHAILDVT